MPPRPPSRRSTLGPVSTNRRTSLGGNTGGPSGKGGAALPPGPSKAGPTSNGTGAGGRRSSLAPSSRPRQRKSMIPLPSPAPGKKGPGGRRQSLAPGPSPSSSSSSSRRSSTSSSRRSSTSSSSSRTGAGGGSSSGRGRASMGGNGRRASFAPGGGTAGLGLGLGLPLPPAAPAVRADPRPVSDRAYSQACIRGLLRYLVQSGYEHPVSAKALSRPSGRDFAQIVTFLLRRIDPTFHPSAPGGGGGTGGAGAGSGSAPPLKFEDEVSLAFRTLGYPYPISKTALVAAGSPHTWPTLLAALTWLIELLGCDEAQRADEERDEEREARAGTAAAAAAAEGSEGSEGGDHGHGGGTDGEGGTEEDDDEKKKNKSGGEGEGEEEGSASASASAYSSPSDDDPAADDPLEKIEAGSERAFFRFLGSAYGAFLAGDDAKYASLEEDLIEHFERDNVRIEEEFAALAEQNGALAEQIQAMLRDGDELPTLKKRREDHATDLEKFYDLVQKLEEHRSSLREKVEERTTELAERNSELDAAQGKIRTMKARIETQELTVDDARRMDAERERAEEGAAAAARARADHAKGAWEGELEVRKAVERLREAAARYDELAGGLGLEGLVVDPGRAHEEGARGLLGGADLEGSVLASIRELKASYGERYSSAKQRMSALLDEEQACEEKRTECADRVKILEAKAKNLEETLKRERDEQEGTLAVRLREIDSIETKISSLRDPVALEAAIAKYQRQCTQLETLRQKNQEEHAALNEAVQAEISDALASLAVREEHIQTKLRELEDHIADREANLLQL